MNCFHDFMQCPLCGNFFPDILELGSLADADADADADVSCPEKIYQQVWVNYQQHITDSVISLIQGLHHGSVVLEECDTATCYRFHDRASWAMYMHICELSEPKQRI